MQPHPPNELLQIDQVSNNYEGSPLLQGVSFSLAAGEIICLLGPSGSGKTTLLRLIAGLEIPQDGRILLHGEDLASTPAHKRNFGMMFQEYALFPHKTVAENIAFGLQMRKMDTASCERKVAEMLALVGLAGLGERAIDELSGGERQRVALARSLAPEPRLLLLDEPLGSLDRSLRDRLAREIRAILKKMQLTAIMVTHDQAEAFRVADRVAILHQGKLEQLARAEEIYRQPASEMVARFLGFGNIIDAGELLPAISTGIQLPPRPPGCRKILIRPDGARVCEAKEAQLCGQVTDCCFEGNCYKMTIMVETMTLLFDIPIDPAPPVPGATVCLAISPGALVWLP